MEISEQAKKELKRIFENEKIKNNNSLINNVINHIILIHDITQTEIKRITEENTELKKINERLYMENHQMELKLK